MASITVSLPDDMAALLEAHTEQLPLILELGLRELKASDQGGFDGAAAVLELLASLPSPEEILQLRPSARLAERVEELLRRNRDGEMTAADEAEWARYEYLEHLVRIAKNAAQSKLALTAGNG